MMERLARVSTGGAITLDLAGTSASTGNLIGTNSTQLIVMKISSDADTGTAQAYLNRYVSATQEVPSEEPEAWAWLLTVGPVDVSGRNPGTLVEFLLGGSNREGQR